jgi:pimeloyl-ACP methyl ester carboxylesterase
LVATAPLDSAARAGLYGAYEVAPGHVVSAFDLNGGNLRFTDYHTGQQSTMYPVARDSFVSGPGQSVAWPVTDTFKLVRGADGRAKELRWWSKGKGMRAARRLMYPETTLSCTNDSTSLGGTLILPAGPGPHPVIIVTPGDFGSSRDALRGYAFNFVRRGVAALVFDSRGAGGSTGPVASSSFDALAGDVLAWVALLRERSEIDPKSIGLFGFSNSSWTVSLAASRSKDVAFLVPQSMSALHPWQQERFRAERQIRIAGYPEKDVREAVEIMDLKFEVARTGEGWDRLQEANEKHRDDRWLPYTNPSRSLERLRAYWDRSFSYDPKPALERVTCPTLFVFGGIDSNVPVDASIPIINQAMETAGNKRYVIRVFPRGRHDLIEGKDGGPKEFPLMKRFVPGYWDALADWVAEGWRGGGVVR